MRFALEGEEHKYLAGNEFIMEMKKAPEWMVHTNLEEQCLVLRVRDKPIGPWTTYFSPSAIKMTAIEWFDFTQTVERVAELRGAELLHEQPEQHSR